MEATTTKHTKNIKIKQCDRTTRLVRRVAHPVHHPSTLLRVGVPPWFGTRIQDSTPKPKPTTTTTTLRTGNNQKYRSTYQYMYIYE